MCRQRDAKVTVPLTPQPSSTQLEQQSEIGVFLAISNLKDLWHFWSVALLRE